MATIGWSYAAAVYLGIDLSVLLHSEYKGGGQYICWIISAKATTLVCQYFNG
jgi:hypothetical protein